MKKLSSGYEILEPGESLPDSTMAMIEARDDNHEWGSDYVGGTSMTIGEARDAIREMKNNIEVRRYWKGWEFRIVADNDGSYSVLV